MFGKNKDKVKEKEIGEVLKGLKPSDDALEKLKVQVERMGAIVEGNDKNLRNAMEEMTKAMAGTLKKHERK